MESAFDKRTIGAFVIIGVIIALWIWKFAPKPAETPAGKPGDTTASVAVKTDSTKAPPAPAPKKPAEVYSGSKYAPLIDTSHHYVTIETPTYKAILNSSGGTLARFELKNYKTWYKAPVQLISDSVGFPGVLGVEYQRPDGKQVSTADLTFSFDSPEKIVLTAKDSAVITATLSIPPDSTSADSTPSVITKRFVFHGDNYGIGLDVTMQNMKSEIAANQYGITWNQGLKYQEHNSVDESSRAHALVESGDEVLTEVNVKSPTEPIHQNVPGPVIFAGQKLKYFGSAIIPVKPLANASVTVNGHAANADSSGLVESYGVTLNVPYTQPIQSDHFTVFIGPLEYASVKSFGLTSMIDMGWKLVIRPIAEFFMLPIFRFLHSFISNWGLVIIVFSVIIRLLLWPLSIPQIRSSRKMQLLQPKIAEMKLKHGDDKQKIQMEQMALYREYGINPLGGCLPLLLQMPILYALYGTLSTVIELRQADFALWIHDLSVPDMLIHLPAGIPLLGTHLSGLALLMGITMFIQQKQVITDPSQKMMVYIMPIFLTLVFNNLPAGLNLYYFTFNLLSIGQQIYLTKISKNSMTLEQMRREASAKKKGWFAQKMEDAQKMAQMQSQGQSKVNGRTPVEPKKKA